MSESVARVWGPDTGDFGVGILSLSPHLILSSE